MFDEQSKQWDGEGEHGSCGSQRNISFFEHSSYLLRSLQLHRECSCCRLSCPWQGLVIQWCSWERPRRWYEFHIWSLFLVPQNFIGLGGLSANLTKITISLIPSIEGQKGPLWSSNLTLCMTQAWEPHSVISASNLSWSYSRWFRKTASDPEYCSSSCCYYSV